MTLPINNGAHILKPIHPFPARMAPTIVEDILGASNKYMRVLDPMMGSGTVLATARLMGHKVYGIDSDPLAVLISKTWCSDFDPDSLFKKGELVLEKASKINKIITIKSILSSIQDKETEKFIRYWFDTINIKQLFALSLTIKRIKNDVHRNFLWCAFSRMIITKSNGVSRAIDISHSRPHRVFDTCPRRPFEVFLYSLKTIINRAPFTKRSGTPPKANIRRGDSRSIALKPNSIDLIITSPPYFNAIDYMRGHKFSLVWMGYKIHELRGIRSANIGSENHLRSKENDVYNNIVRSLNIYNSLPGNQVKTILQYLGDMDKVLEQSSKLLIADGRLYMVIGNCIYKNIFIDNSKMVKLLATYHGLNFVSENHRYIPSNRRYLPPPESHKAGNQLQNRLSEEFVIHFKK